MSRVQPNLVSVTTIASDGSRRMLQPADVRGRFTILRRISALLLVAVYIALPWIPVNGFPAVFLDVVNRRFHFIGLTLATQDLWIGVFLITGLAFSLFYVSSIFGRVWCGWTCPYTVFLEHIFRRVERLIDGDAQARRHLEDAPLSAGKIFKRTLKHTIYFFLATIIAHIFISYFVSIPQLYSWMHRPPTQHWFAFCAMAAITGGLYFAFSWFREQFCIILCPYGRLQSALTDDNTVIIGYDKKRGEPRGKVGTTGAGDCINCLRCVQVCPTGIDIRNGLQLECIGCAACVDACDDIMRKVGRSTGLVRYDSLNGLNGQRTRYIRPRTVLYSVLTLAGVVVFGLSFSTIKPVRITTTRMIGAPFFVNGGLVRNQFNLRIINKRSETVRYTVSLAEARGVQLGESGIALDVPAFGEVMQPVVLTLPEKEYRAPIALRLRVAEQRENGITAERDVEFLGPDNRLQNNDYLDPKKYLQH